MAPDLVAGSPREIRMFCAKFTRTVGKRSPVLGYNHNFKHRGLIFHVQTEDSGVDNPHLFTHLFHGGVIISSRKVDYDVEASEDTVKGLMQSQHKAVLKDLKTGTFDDKIDAYLGNREDLEPRKTGSGDVATPEPAELEAAEASEAASEALAAEPSLDLEGLPEPSLDLDLPPEYEDGRVEDPEEIQAQYKAEAPTKESRAIGPGPISQEFKIPPAVEKAVGSRAAKAEAETKETKPASLGRDTDEFKVPAAEEKVRQRSTEAETSEARPVSLGPESDEFKVPAAKEVVRGTEQIEMPSMAAGSVAADILEDVAAEALAAAAEARELAAQAEAEAAHARKLQEAAEAAVARARELEAKAAATVKTHTEPLAAKPAQQGLADTHSGAISLNPSRGTQTGQPRRKKHLPTAVEMPAYSDEGLGDPTVTFSSGGSTPTPAPAQARSAVPTPITGERSGTYSMKRPAQGTTQRIARRAAPSKARTPAPARTAKQRPGGKAANPEPGRPRNPVVVSRPAVIIGAPPKMVGKKGGRKPAGRKARGGGSVFGKDLISEKSLDEVIMAYLSEDSSEE
jgi:hypothetical protein